MFHLLPWVVIVILVVMLTFLYRSRAIYVKEEAQLAQFVVIMLLVQETYDNNRKAFVDAIKSQPIQENDLGYLTGLIVAAGDGGRSFISKIREPMIVIIEEVRKLKS